MGDPGAPVVASGQMVTVYLGAGGNTAEVSRSLQSHRIEAQSI